MNLLFKTKNHRHHSLSTIVVFILLLMMCLSPDHAFARDITNGIKQISTSAKGIGSDVLVIGAVAIGVGILLGFASFGQAITKWIFGACFILGASAWVSTAQGWFGRL